jgi:hypothetical protein
LWWLPGGGSLGSWGVTVHGEEETVFQLLKRVRMPPSMAAPVGVVFLVGSDVGASFAPFFHGEPRIWGRPRLTMAPVGVVALVGGVMGALDDGEVCVTNSVWGHHLRRYSSEGCVDGLVVGSPSPRVSRVETKVKRHVIYHLQRRVSAAGV